MLGQCSACITTQSWSTVDWARETYSRYHKKNTVFVMVDCSEELKLLGHNALGSHEWDVVISGWRLGQPADLKRAVHYHCLALLYITGLMMTCLLVSLISSQSRIFCEKFHVIRSFCNIFIHPETLSVAYARNDSASLRPPLWHCNFSLSLRLHTLVLSNQSRYFASYIPALLVVDFPLIPVFNIALHVLSRLALSACLAGVSNPSGELLIFTDITYAKFLGSFCHTRSKRRKAISSTVESPNLSSAGDTVCFGGRLTWYPWLVS